MDARTESRENWTPAQNGRHDWVNMAAIEPETLSVYGNRTKLREQWPIVYKGDPISISDVTLEVVNIAIPFHRRNQ